MKREAEAKLDSAMSGVSAQFLDLALREANAAGGGASIAHFMYIYMYTCMCIYIYMYVYIYTYTRQGWRDRS